MNLFSSTAAIFLTASTYLASLTVLPANAQSPSKKSVVLNSSNDISITVPISEYTDLIDGNISEYQSKDNEYSIRRRLGTRPVAYDDGGKKLFTLYFDIFNQEDELIETKVHNKPKPLTSSSNNSN